MRRTHVNVLILGERPEGFSHLKRHLEQHDSQVVSAHSVEESVIQFPPHSFDLVLSVKPLHPSHALLELLQSDNSSVYYCFPVEDGCWWLPLICEGEKCFGAPAFRPSEFLGELDRVVKQLQLGKATETTLVSYPAA